jgi:uncharacterized protein YbjQ (UPF0145 family)
MGFFSWGKNKSEDELRQEAIQKQSLENLKNGGIPVKAIERIERELALGKGFYSSDFSVREHLLAQEAGLTVVGQVMGSSFFNTSFFGLMRSRWRQTGELVDLTRTHMEARKLALSRMTQEAEMLGATGIIGVRLKAKMNDWSSRLTEFTAIGTAVRIPGHPPGKPFCSDLSVQEFWQLHRAGYVPAGLALGMCSYYMYTDYATERMLYSFWGMNATSNMEVPLYTQGFQNARETAMQRLTQDIYDHKADGVVGMHVSFDLEDVEYESNDRTYHDLIAHFTAIGTSINYRPDLKPAPVPPPMMVLSLAGRGSGRRYNMSDLAISSSNNLSDDDLDDFE